MPTNAQATPRSPAHAHRFVRRVLLLLMALQIFAACTATGTYELEFMAAPTVCSSGALDPFQESGINSRQDVGVLYATDREPSGADDKDTPFYRNKRGRQLRFGEAFMEITGRGDDTWEESKRIGFSEDRERDYLMRVTKVSEFGVYDKSQPALLGEPRDPAPAEQFARTIDTRLASSPSKDVYIYVHRYRAEFTFPVLVSAQLWYYLGLRGVFVAYSWPATPNIAAYFKDLETAGYTTRQLRLLLEFLATRTQVRRIHLIGYSAGTRVVTETIGQIALIHQGRTAEEAVAITKIGQVILVGADVDPGRMNGYLEDGALDVIERMTIYQSDTDGPLGVSESRSLGAVVVEASGGTSCQRRSRGCQSNRGDPEDGSPVPD